MDFLQAQEFTKVKNLGGISDLLVDDSAVEEK